MLCFSYFVMLYIRCALVFFLYYTLRLINFGAGNELIFGTVKKRLLRNPQVEFWWWQHNKVLEGYKSYATTRAMVP